ncbi:proline/glycine betaine ABC transporter permease ProW [Fulvimarina endophytica]|uniref:Proline/glycine betaine ABC transporter permease ProW n=1 Tax=Fulvimarina endophytica TaxID=2293836 RepID=A0A371X551_9HYPH|nr:glycine betaine/L-proline ABC transporter permease ProW [Fulvimarina endophytica]RFC64355.1 proline/glycine betaine ABC transporter permease ProW [Fulvimarina endophytica]
MVEIAQADNPWATGGASQPAAGAATAPTASDAAAANPWGGAGSGAPAGTDVAQPGAPAATPDWLANAAPPPDAQGFDILHPFGQHGHAVIPLDDWVTTGLNWVVENLRPIFQAIRIPVDGVLTFIEATLQSTPPILMILLIGLLAWQISGRGLAIGSVLSLIFVGLIGAWEQSMVTLALVFTSVFFCVVIGLPTGIWLARNDRAATTMRPILDAMQTTPAFVYLVPIVMLFGIGNVPGVVVTIIFALPPLIRLTNLAIRQVPADLIEASRSFGASSRQMLYKVQLPIAMPTIMAGVNQTLMLALSMVVIASMIAVGGLGQMVLRGIGRLDMGLATVGGVGIVILAILIDRMTQSLARSRRDRGNKAWHEVGPIGFVRGAMSRGSAVAATEERAAAGKASA